jgi:hypothetical protein
LKTQKLKKKKKMATGYFELSTKVDAKTEDTFYLRVLDRFCALRKTACGKYIFYDGIANMLKDTVEEATLFVSLIYPDNQMQRILTAIFSHKVWIWHANIKENDEIWCYERQLHYNMKDDDVRDKTLYTRIWQQMTYVPFIANSLHHQNHC